MSAASRRTPRRTPRTPRTPSTPRPATGAAPRPVSYAHHELEVRS
ncbi:hypothetical protein OG735_30125 [Streptomyces sp. NBC_01210]|nr:hypothetical protein OG735_30125 [Streptomyces sp. NBC_01210]